MQMLMENKIIGRKMFAINLNFKKPNLSFITFGASDPRFWNSSTAPKYYPFFNNTMSYAVNLTGVYFGSENNKYGRVKIFLALVDSGNTCITFPSILEDIIL